MLSIADAVKAYRHSTYNEVEWQLMHRIDENSTPWIGGWTANLGSWGNWLARWPKVGFAFLFGFSGDPREVSKTELPEGIAGTQYGSDLDGLRNGLREIADSKVKKIDYYLHLHLQAGYRQNAVIAHQKARLERVVMPEDQIEKETRRDQLLSRLQTRMDYAEAALPTSGLPPQMHGENGNGDGRMAPVLR